MIEKTPRPHHQKNAALPTRHPSRALASPGALLPELQRNFRNYRGVAVPGLCREQLTQTLIVRSRTVVKVIDCAFVENVLF